MKMRIPGVVLVLGMAAPLAAQDVPDATLQAKIDDAINRGVAYLKTAESVVAWEAMGNSDELILWTLVHADVSPKDETYRAMLEKMLAAPLQRTYKVALQAMVLEEIDRVKYQERIWQCAQFLMDNQCVNGQWSYGEPTQAITSMPTPVKIKEVATGPVGVRDFRAAAKKEKPKVVRKIPVKPTKSGPATGDNSNSQYASLGLRACHEAGILFPKESLALAKKWWMDCQHSGDKEKKVATGKFTGEPRGWCYDVRDGHPAYGSMSAGAIGSVALLDYMLDLDWKKDPVVASGMSWLSAHFTVTENFGPPQERPAGTAEFLYYYLYALERAGILVGTETIGGHRWYIEGAKFLVEDQKPTGAWEHAGDWNKPTWNTCFAILFLKRATRPLVASTDR
ncbi:MAG TPA: hypothetical protein VNM14_06825 [Planctomycetota bacterium]|nr:hypothetical protein [Planctomycetota bacterium]